MAVSKALRDEPDISQATKERVRLEAERRGYYPNESARNLRVKRSGLVGLILPDLATEEGSSVAGGFCEAARKGGVAVQVGLAGNARDEAEQVRTMMGRGVEAIFVLPRISTEHRSAALEPAKKAGLPILFFKRYPADVGPGSGKVSWVVRNMKEAAQRVLDHLSDLGHRKVAYLGGHSAARSHAEHLQAVQEGVAARGMMIAGGAQMAGLKPEDGEREMEKILESKERPTAVICGSDSVAAGASRAILNAGLSIPGTISLTGLGDELLSRYGPISLTTVRFPNPGQAGFELWRKAREGEEEMKPVLLPAELIVRNSTGKA
ncbi:MAG: LacI family transcriptional regulator [Verrucomicrobia bacterium]|nr:LacI family transcriptional regulator [Verrucomicrobiota bacterium]